MTTTVCPSCGKDDKIQKVSSIYTNGVSTTQYDQPIAIQVDGKMVYGTQKQTATTLTNLAKKLSPPPEPPLPFQYNSCGGGIVLFIWMIVAIFGGWFVGSQAFGWNEGITMLASVGLFLAPIINYFMNVAAGKRKYQELYPDWQRKTVIWSELYYCYRDDCVFDPKKGKAVSPVRMNDLFQTEIDNSSSQAVKNANNAEDNTIFNQVDETQDNIVAEKTPFVSFFQSRRIIFWDWFIFIAPFILTSILFYLAQYVMDVSSIYSILVFLIRLLSVLYLISRIFFTVYSPPFSNKNKLAFILGVDLVVYIFIFYWLLNQRWMRF